MTAGCDLQKINYRIHLRIINDTLGSVVNLS